MAYTWKDGELITAEKLNNTGSGGLTIVNVVADGSDNAPPVVRSIDKTPGEIIAAIEAGNYVIARVVINYPNAPYPQLCFLNPPAQASFPDDGTSPILLFTSEDVDLIIPRDESLPAEISLSGGSSPGQEA